MSRGPLGRLLAPSSVAVIGASPTPGKAGNALLGTLADFPGSVYPVHPKAASVNELPAYPRVADVPGAVDLALIALPARSVPGAVAECREAGVGGVVVHAGGFAETGPDGARLQAELKAAIGDGGMRVLGPNTSGFIAPPLGLFATFVAAAAQIPAGPLAIVAQSGGVNHALAFAAAREGLGQRLAVGLGNASDVTVADVLRHLGSDEEVGVVALALEGIDDGRDLLDAVGELTERVPVVALKVGHNEKIADFARSHTGAMTGSRAAARALLREAGAVVVDDTTALLDAARALAGTRLKPKLDPGVAVFTGQAGPGLLLADALAASGVSMPRLGAAAQARLTELLGGLTFVRNPVDTGRPGASLEEALRTVEEDTAVDLIAAYFLDEPDALDPVALLGGRRRVPAVFGSAGPSARMTAVQEALGAHGVKVFPTPERAATAAVSLVEDARAADARAAARREAIESPEEALLGPARATGWDEDRAKGLLERIGIACPRRHACGSEEEVLIAAERLGFPVAVKLLHADLRHKTELGGVHLGLATPNDLADALGRLRAVPAPAGARYLVEQMAPSGPELLLAAVDDPTFGPIVMLGAGGVEAELLADVTTRRAPVAPVEARSMLGDLKTADRFRGFRGGPAVDEGELAGLVVAIGTLLVAEPALAEIEVNPLRVTRGGILALDALVSE